MRILCALVILGLASDRVRAAELQSKTLRGFERYVALTEERIATELGSGDGFLVQHFLPPADASACRQVLAAGRVFARKMETRNEEGGKLPIQAGMVHHWMGSVLVRGAELSNVLEWVQNYSNHAKYFEEVEESRLVDRAGDVFHVFLRLKRKKLITVHYATEHTVEYRTRGPKRVSSRSEATRIAEIENPGMPAERERPQGKDRGYLWRLNSYWRFEEVAEGVIVECESVSLSRDVPTGLSWLVAPFIRSVPRESLEATLAPMRDALGRNAGRSSPGVAR